MSHDAAMVGASGYARNAHDAYWTPSWCTRALIDCPDFKPRGFILEPAVGKGHIADVLRREFPGTLIGESDIFDHNDGLRHRLIIRDFLTTDRIALLKPCTIITNPPYTQAEEFVRYALKITEPEGGIVAMLLRNEWDCASSRRDLFEQRPFAMKLVLTKRPRWSEDNKASPRHNFAWFVWDWERTEPAILRYGPSA